MQETVFLVGFFKFDERGPEYGFKRIHLQHIFKTEKEAREQMSFCNGAGSYEGALIEERAVGQNYFFRGVRIWLTQEKDGQMKEFSEPKDFRHVLGLIG